MRKSRLRDCYIKASLESYVEGEDSTFTHDGVVYQLDPVIAYAQKKDVDLIDIESLRWNVENIDIDPERVKNADPDVPIIVTSNPKFGLVVLDGTHRLMKALNQGRTVIAAYQIEENILPPFAISEI